MKTLDEFTRDELNQKGITYMTQTKDYLLYEDKERIYYFEPIGIRKIEGIPFVNSNDCEKYKLIKTFKNESRS